VRRSLRADLLERLSALETFGIKLGLENITSLCAALGHPERAFRSLHIAGTNGKGSVTAMVHAGLVAAGTSAARYVSPHLVDLAERFVIGMDPVKPQDLERVANTVLDCADQLRADGVLSAHPTFFEATTAIAFELFRQAGVETAVIEVGLGGRFDSTNIISPLAGAITSIGFDHQQFLGHTIDDIAREKAGIIKEGMTVVTGVLPERAREVIAATAVQRSAVVIDAAADAHVDIESKDGRLVVVITTPEDRYGPLTLGLRGDHQIGNALVAVRLLEAARRAGLPVTRTAIERGLANVEWPGRLELISLPDGARVLLDAAHNLDGARALAAYLRCWHPERPALVMGVMRDKDIEGMINVLLPSVSSVVATAADTPRAIPASELVDRIRAQAPAIPVQAEPDPIRAVDHALGLSSTVCVAGSVYLVGAVRDPLRHRAILR
jgi:dihydrofolate synthase / folylpolyglutamate synthase